MAIASCGSIVQGLDACAQSKKCVGQDLPGIMSSRSFSSQTIKIVTSTMEMLVQVVLLVQLLLWNNFCYLVYET